MFHFLKRLENITFANNFIHFSRVSFVLILFFIHKTNKSFNKNFSDFLLYLNSLRSKFINYSLSVMSYMKVSYYRRNNSEYSSRHQTQILTSLNINEFGVRGLWIFYFIIISKRLHLYLFRVLYIKQTAAINLKKKFFAFS